MSDAVEAFISAAIEAAAAVYGHPTVSIVSDRGRAEDSWVRQVAMYVAMEIGRIPSGKAAKHFDRDDSTVRYARKAVSDRLELYPEDKARVAQIARMALDRAPGLVMPVRDSLSPWDSAFVGRLMEVFTRPEYASDAARLRKGKLCITYSDGGALALHPFNGKP